MQTQQKHESDNTVFLTACARAADEGRPRGSIGTLGEKTLHAALKYYYEPDSSRHEIPVGGYVADIVGEEGIIEIQTRNLSGMKPKLTVFLEAARVTVVHPVICRRRLISTDAATGEVLSVRYSPKKETLFTATRELYGLRTLLTHPRLTVRLPLLTADEPRRFGVKTARRKKQHTRRGEFVSDLVPTGLLGEIVLAAPEDYEVFLTACAGTLPEEFGSSELAAAAPTAPDAARRILNLLAMMGLLEVVGKNGNARRYRRTEKTNKIP